MTQFEEFPKIARLSRPCVITEKIDGTNAQVHIVPTVDVPILEVDPSYVLATNEAGDIMLAGSRSRNIVPAADNYGFASWVKAHAADLWALGPGRHFGEWWGSGIQRGYGLPKGEKRFSLFNVARWADDLLTVVSADHLAYLEREGPRPKRPECCGVVPVLYRGPFCTNTVASTLNALAGTGSVASPGFMKPEGLVIWHEAARTMFKKTIEKDEEPKGAAR